MKDKDYYIYVINKILEACDKDTIKAIYIAISNITKKR